ncbi:GbsR/MarR family transcriptional regulator [Denitromonas iodatirespirans]|uniref:HTH-type transcriptional regulator n=1 Tax=Denitromonas iodatirespirans TaxID=2795389 RepID=A0A944D9B3_DENI1|nr:MarR family transcriptional regulator [Denitromonas iodatirespirans]MBT0960388.1 MarR family transcriptional regulator [Denitromonas iodatirespirans]
MELKPVAQRFVLHWGEMGSRWGVNRSVAQIHALLYLVGRPMHAEEIQETLGIARSNVSNSLKELQSWELVRLCHVLGDRRDHFDTSADVWELFRTIVLGRKRREIDPTLEVLRDCLASPDLALEDAAARKRIEDTLVLMQTLTGWSEEMLRLKPDTLMKIMKLGAKIQNLVRKG